MTTEIQYRGDAVAMTRHGRQEWKRYAAGGKQQSGTSAAGGNGEELLITTGNTIIGNIWDNAITQLKKNNMGGLVVRHINVLNVLNVLTCRNHKLGTGMKYT